MIWQIILLTLFVWACARVISFVFNMGMGNYRRRRSDGSPR